MGKKLFDYVIGNPPYNEDFENSGDNGNYAKPVYNFFMDATYEIANKVELILSLIHIQMCIRDSLLVQHIPSPAEKRVPVLLPLHQQDGNGVCRK